MACTTFVSIVEMGLVAASSRQNRSASPSKTLSIYDELEGLIIAEARKRGISPSQRQVEIWCEQRGDPLSYGDILRRRQLNRRTLLTRLI